jgi:hypothetical protein
MKNYIANENGTWDTSAACIRRTLLKCIEVGRRAKGGNDADSYEAYRLLGTAVRSNSADTFVSHETDAHV